MSEDIEILDDINIENEESNDEIVDNEEVDEEHYQAKRMTDEEVQRIDDLWKEEPYTAKKLSDEEVQRIDDLWKDDPIDPEYLYSDTNDFIDEVEHMDFADLEKEQERLDGLAELSNDEIFDEYDKQQYLPNIDKMNKEELTNYKAFLENIRDSKDGEDGDDTPKVRVRKR